MITNKKLLVILLVLLFGAQWSAPGVIISRAQDVIKNGTPFKFKVQPADPADYFRGRYANLNYEARTLSTAFTNLPKIGQYNIPAFAQLGTDSAGFATVEFVHAQKPAASIEYIEVEVSIYYPYAADESTEEGTITIQYPFSRYYLPETKAPLVDTFFAENDTTHVIYALVKVKSGKSYLENVFVNDIPLLEFINQKLKN